MNLHIVRAGPDAGLVLDPLEQFRYIELGAFLPGDRFTRNHFVDQTEVDRWRERFENTGIFRTVLRSNLVDLEHYIDDPETLWYGDLCFDFDIGSAQRAEVEWPKLIHEVETRLLPALRRDWGLPDAAIRIWFSGGRGLHIELPAASLGAWADAELHRIYGAYATGLIRSEGLQYLDASLYGGRHLYRLEYSIHQRTKLFKYPLRVGELRAIRTFNLAQCFGARPRRVNQGFFLTPSATLKAQAQFERLVQQVKQTVAPPATELPTTNTHYDRSRALCVTAMFAPGYRHQEGSRYNLAFFLAAHLKQGGFSYDQALHEIEEWATHHCDPPFTAPADRAEWTGMLKDLYSTPSHGMRVGCSALQHTAPGLCSAGSAREAACPIGQARLKRFGSVQP